MPGEDRNHTNQNLTQFGKESEPLLEEKTKLLIEVVQQIRDKGYNAALEYLKNQLLEEKMNQKYKTEEQKKALLELENRVKIIEVLYPIIRLLTLKTTPYSHSGV